MEDCCRYAFRPAFHLPKRWSRNPRPRSVTTAFVARWLAGKFSTIPKRLFRRKWLADSGKRRLQRERNENLSVPLYLHRRNVARSYRVAPKPIQILPLLTFKRG